MDIGTFVHYILTEDDAEEVNSRHPETKPSKKKAALKKGKAKKTSVDDEEAIEAPEADPALSEVKAGREAPLLVTSFTNDASGECSTVSGHASLDDTEPLWQSRIKHNKTGEFGTWHAAHECLGIQATKETLPDRA